MIVQYIKVLTSLWAFSCLNTSTGRREGRRGAKNTWYQFWSNGFRSVHICCVIRTLSSASLPPRIPAADDTGCHTFARVGRPRGRARDGHRKPSLSRAGPPVPLARQPIQSLSSILAGRFVPSLPRAQHRAPPAYHYKASGPYCITDGADRRERRQPACFLER